MEDFGCPDGEIDGQTPFSWVGLATRTTRILTGLILTITEHQLTGFQDGEILIARDMLVME